MIPKIIHYCWFGKSKLPEELQFYMRSWEIFCPDYEIKLWDESTFDIDSSDFTRVAYDKKKFAFVSDYVRAYALYKYGGIYLDTDVEIRQSLDSFLSCDAFSGFESLGLPFTAVWGSQRGHPLAKKILDYYDNNNYSTSTQTNTNIVSEILVQDFNIDPLKDSFQLGTFYERTIAIYASHYFCVDIPINYTVHHFYGSWLPNKIVETKTSINLKYHLARISNSKLGENEFSSSIAQSINFKILINIIIKFIYFKIVPKSLDAYIRNYINK